MNQKVRDQLEVIFNQKGEMFYFKIERYGTFSVGLGFEAGYANNQYGGLNCSGNHKKLEDALNIIIQKTIKT